MNKRLFGKLAAAAIGAGALALAIPGPAYANSASVSPGTVAPGGTITLSVDCTNRTDGPIEAIWGQPGGHQPHGTGTINLLEGSGRTTFTIPAGTTPGSYFAGALCPGDSESTTGSFTVSPTGAPRGGTGLEDHGTALALAGAGTLAAAGAAGGFLLMRRRADAPVA